ncbi:hypothetical protein V8C42DRAFT_315619 [Trichoderma barbatum]
MPPWVSVSAFPRFSRFPPELRLEIWRKSLPDLDSITLHKYKKGCWGPRALPKPESEAEAEIEVDDLQGPPQDIVNFDFRHEMLDSVHVDLPLAFVNREARSVALTWLRQRGVEMRFDNDRNCRIFEQKFDPRRDALFINVNQWNDFCLEPFDRLAQPDLSSNPVNSSTELRRIAIPHTTIGTDCSSLADVFHWFPHLEKLFIVLDIQIDSKLETLLLRGDRKKARARMMHQQWKAEDAREKTLVWNGANRRFEWKGGAGMGNTELYRKMDEIAKEIRWRLAEREAGSFKIQPVYAVKG